MRNARGWWDRQERINFGEPVSDASQSCTLLKRRRTHSCVYHFPPPIPKVPENDDLQSMWAPDVHKVRPSSALGQLLMAFAGVGLFAFGVYSIKPNHPAVRRFSIS